MPKVNMNFLLHGAFFKQKQNVSKNLAGYKKLAKCSQIWYSIIV